MHYFTYVIRSIEHGKLYHGHTNNLAKRIITHNSGKTKSIRAFLPYELVYYEIFKTRDEAIQREKYFKTAAGRRFIKRKLKNMD